MTTSPYNAYNTRLANLSYWGQQDYKKVKKEREEKAEMEKAAEEEEKATPPPQPSKYQVANEKYKKNEYVKTTNSIGKKVITTPPNTLPKDKGVPGNKNKIKQKDPECVEKWKKNNQTASLTQPKVNNVAQDSLHSSSNAPTPSDEKKDDVPTTNEKQNESAQPDFSERKAKHITAFNRLETIIKQLPPSDQQTAFLNAVQGYLIHLQNPSFALTKEFLEKAAQTAREVKELYNASVANTAQKN